MPRTDAGAELQAVMAAVLVTIAFLAVRRHGEMRVLVGGLAVMTAAWFALRTVH